MVKNMYKSTVVAAGIVVGLPPTLAFEFCLKIGRGRQKRDRVATPLNLPIIHTRDTTHTSRAAEANLPCSKSA